MNHLVSIVTPCYNHGKFLRETYASLKSQTYPYWEWMVVDDGSTDDSREVLSTLAAQDTRIRPYFLSEHLGIPGKVRNAGILKAKGDFLAFIDSDDLWHPRKIEIQLEFHIDSKYGISATDFVNFSSRRNIDNVFIRTTSALRKKIRPVSVAELLRKNIIACSSVMIDRRQVPQVYFSEENIRPPVEDYDLWLSLAAEGHSVVLVESVLTGHRLHDTNISASKIKMAQNVARMKLRHIKKLGIPKIMLLWYMLTHIVMSLMQIINKKSDAEKPHTV